MDERKSALQSDLAKVDAHRIGQADYEDVAELGDEFFERADEHRAGVLVKRGRGRHASSSDKSH